MPFIIGTPVLAGCEYVTWVQPAEGPVGIGFGLNMSLEDFPDIASKS